MERRASWIWRDRGVVPGAAAAIEARLDRNLFVQFRRAFRLDHDAEAAKVRISADGRYKLYVNGVYAGRGPARCDPLFQYYDTYDIARLMQRGNNVFAVLAHSYGRDMSWYELPRAHWARTLGCGGLFFECDVAEKGGDHLTIDSDATWRYAVANAWDTDTPAGSVGFVEVYDARNDTGGWTDAGFDDSAWTGAVVLRAPGFGFAPDVEPFPRMVERDTPPMLEEPRDALRVLEPREIILDDTTDMISLAETRDVASPAACSIERASAMLTGGGSTDIAVAAGRALTMVLDFGRNVTGYPHLELDAPAGATLDVSYGEQLRDDGRVPVQRANPITSQNVHRYITRDGAQAWEKFERAGFRYLQLTVAPPAQADGARIAVRRANVNFTSYPVSGRGTFACSDDLLTRIWRAGAETLQLCMHDGYEDCPTREQRQWVGDAYVESLVNFACFGDPALTAKLIRQVAQSQMRDGMTKMATPGDMSARWPLFIVDFCLYGLMTIGEYVQHTGDDQIVGEVLPSVVRAISWFEAHIGGDGLLVEPPGWIFIDWAQVDRRGACTALNALFVQALHHAATLADHEGAKTHARRWRALARRVSTALNERLWDDARGVYVDALLPQPGGELSTMSRRVSQHANASMIAAGIAPRRRWKHMLDYVTDERRLVATNTQLLAAPDGLDEAREVVLAQPFFTHHVHRALVAAGRTERMLDSIRRRWAPMLDESGTGTLWEHWHGEASRCHAWSATPTYDLSREVLGVRPAAPGFARFRVEPHVAGLHWAEGRYPSVRGDIPVSWRREGERFALSFESPAGTEAEFVVPAGATDVTINGHAAGTWMKRGEQQLLRGLAEGVWRIEAVLRAGGR